MKRREPDGLTACAVLLTLAGIQWLDGKPVPLAAQFLLIGDEAFDAKRAHDEWHAKQGKPSEPSNR